MKSIALTFFTTVTLVFLLLNPAYSEEILNKSILDKDTTWQGEILIKGDVEVAKGATLTIMPGTTVRFAKIDEFGSEKLSQDRLSHFPRAELIVRGHLYSQGTPQNKIVFTSAEEVPHPGDWGSINLLNTDDNIIEYCIVKYAHTGVHAHSAQVVVAHSEFHHNSVAIGQKNLKNLPKSVLPMLYNTITDNGGGILYGGGSTPTISHNEINNNKFFGIYAKKGGLANVRYNNITGNGKGVIFFKVKTIHLRDNNISDNTDYNVSMLEGQATDINVSGNYWGTTDKGAIKKLIKDHDWDETLGAVDFSDFLQTPVAGAGLK